MKVSAVEVRSWILRLFAGSWTSIFALVAALLRGSLPDSGVWLWPLGIACLFAFGLFLPALMRHPYRLVEWSLAPVGRLFALLVLALIYFGVFTPYALVLRLVGWNPLRLRKTPWGDSAWIEPGSEPGGDAGRWQY